MSGSEYQRPAFSCGRQLHVVPDLPKALGEVHDHGENDSAFKSLVVTARIFLTMCTVSHYPGMHFIVMPLVHPRYERSEKVIEKKGMFTRSDMVRIHLILSFRFGRYQLQSKLTFIKITVTVTPNSIILSISTTGSQQSRMVSLCCGSDFRLDNCRHDNTFSAWGCCESVSSRSKLGTAPVVARTSNLPSLQRLCLYGRMSQYVSANGWEQCILDSCADIQHTPSTYDSNKRGGIRRNQHGYGMTSDVCVCACAFIVWCSGLLTTRSMYHTVVGSDDPWHWWATLRALCTPVSRLCVALEITADLPSGTHELCLQFIPETKVRIYFAYAKFKCGIFHVLQTYEIIFA